MKKLIFAASFLLLGMYALSAQNLPTIRIVNNTGYQIYHIMISSADDDIWGFDVLSDNEILENGQTFTYQLRAPLNRVSIYDIMLEDEDENIYIKWDVKVTNNARIVFTMDDLDDGEG